jgi:integrase/recombinase XerC
MDIKSMDALVPAREGNLQPLLALFLSGRSPKTLAAYRSDLKHFCIFIGASTIEDAVRMLLGSGQGEGHALVLRCRTALIERGLSPATINRRLAALRSLVKLARLLGFVPWTLDIPGVEASPYRDTRGPGKEGFRCLLAAITGDDAKAHRDRAIVRLLFDLALRREEVVRLDLEDLDLRGGRVAVLGKKRTQKEWLSLPEPTRSALASWIAVRGERSGQLFVSLDRSSSGKRLAGRSVHRIVRDLGKQAGLGAVCPHGLRHAAITEALELTRGNVRAVQRFSRHRDLRTLTLYDDNRQDLAGEIARQVAG